jgi:uncharacterized membrane protein YhfC
MVGGTVWLALVAAGIAAEVAYPAAIVRFGDATMTEFTQPLLTLSTWLYHYCQLGAAALIFATSTVIWRTGALLRLWIHQRRSRRAANPAAGGAEHTGLDRRDKPNPAGVAAEAACGGRLGDYRIGTAVQS